MSTNFFQRPLIPMVPFPEPPEFPLYRDMMFRRIADLQANPYGGQKFSNMGRGMFNPVTGSYGGGGGYGPPAGGGGGGSPSGGGFDLGQLLRVLAARGQRPAGGGVQAPTPQEAPQNAGGGRTARPKGYDAGDDFRRMNPGNHSVPGTTPSGVNPTAETQDVYDRENAMAGSGSRAAPPMMPFPTQQTRPPGNPVAGSYTSSPDADRWRAMNPGSHSIGSTVPQNFSTYGVENALMGGAPPVAAPTVGHDAAPGGGGYGIGTGQGTYVINDPSNPDAGFYVPTTATEADLPSFEGGGSGMDIFGAGGGGAAAGAIGGGGVRRRRPQDVAGRGPGYDARGDVFTAGSDPNNPFFGGPSPSGDVGGYGYRPRPHPGQVGGVTPPPGTESPNNAGASAGWNMAPGSGTQWGGGGGGGGGTNTDMPWLQGWGGNFTAPMSPWETGALNSYSNFASGGGGTAPSQNYYNNVLGGNYLGIDKNPWLGQIQSGMQGIKNYQDAAALKRIQSSMAAGGNAMSGANTAAQGDYLGQSNANFQNTMGNLFNQDYQNERNLQNAAATGSLYSGQQAGNAMSNLFGMGGLPRQLQQNDLNSQYNDWTRQVNNARDAYQYPDYLINQQMGHGYPGSGYNAYGQSGIGGLAALLSQLTGDGSSTGGVNIQDLISQLLGGGGGADTGAPADTGTQGGGDSEPAYDASQPSSYKDANWYKGALTQGEAKQQAAANQKDPNSGLTAVSALLPLILAILGKSGLVKSKSKPGLGVGGGPGGKGPGDQGMPNTQPPPGGQPNNMYGQPIGPEPSWGLNDVPGTTTDPTTGTGYISDWSNYGYPDPITGQQGDFGTNTDLSNYLNQFPTDFTDTGGGGGGGDFGGGQIDPGAF